jgi:DNA-binding transcriptional LysR family regulator
MELKWLQDFVALARTGSFSRAAADRHVTQPAFSRRIRALEHWLGVTLVDRSVFPVLLTRHGETFLPHAQDIIAGAIGIRNDFHTEMRAERRQARIVTLHTLALHVVPELVAPLLHAEPAAGVDIQPTVSGVEAYFDALDAGSADIVVAYAQQRPPERQKQLLECTVARDEMIPVVARRYVMAAGEPRFDAGAKIPVLGYTPFSFSHGVMEATMQRLADSIVERGHSPLSESLKALVLTGLGVAWMPRFTVAAELAAGTLVTLSQPDLSVPLEICAWRRRDLDHPVARRMFDGWAASARLR